MHSFNPSTALVAAAAFMATLPAANAMYPKNSPVLQVGSKDYARLIEQSNHTSVVEFYAPWCGHCQQLKPAYEKAAKSLDGIAKVAAVNCDEETNKPLCGRMGIQGFPTLKTVRPGKKKGSKPIVEDYQGPRTAKGIVDAIGPKINNHVQRIADKDLDGFLAADPHKPRAILFSEKGTTSALLRSLAIDFLDVMPVAQIREKETKANEKFGITSYPTLILIPGPDQPHIVYDGEMKKQPMLKFLSQAAEPNPDPAPKAAKESSKAKAKPSSKSKSPPKPAATEEASADEPEQSEAASSEKPVVVQAPPSIPVISEGEKLIAECLNTKSATCVLAFVPSAHGEAADKALHSLADLKHKHAAAQRKLFPLFEVHTDNTDVELVYKSLELAGEVEIIAVNGKRGWWRQYDGDSTTESIESWIDAIRMSEGAKKKLPSGVISEPTAETETVEVKVDETETIQVDASSEAPSHGADPTPEATPAVDHNEL